MFECGSICLIGIWSCSFNFRLGFLKLSPVFRIGASLTKGLYLSDIILQLVGLSKMRLLNGAAVYVRPRPERSAAYQVVLQKLET